MAEHTFAELTDAIADYSDAKDEGIRTALEEQIEDNSHAIVDIVNVYGAKNLWNASKAVPSTSASTEAILLDNGHTRINGTASRDGAQFKQNFNLSIDSNLPLTLGDKLILSYEVISGSFTKGTSSFDTTIYAVNKNTSAIAIMSFGNSLSAGDKDSKVFTLDENCFDNGKLALRGIQIYFHTGDVFDNLELAIMLRLASIEDSTYVPYVPTNKELMSYKVNGELGAKNLLPYPYHDTTITTNGITWTDNGDGTITVNGTATAVSFFSFYNNISDITKCAFELGKTYKISMELTNASKISVFVNVNNADLTAIRKKSTGYYEAIFTVPKSLSTRFVIALYVSANNTAETNAIVKVMVKEVEDTDPTWQPYAKTNRELTADKANKSDLASISITGTTNNTGSTIASGTYFYLNDVLVKAKVDIASGATFTKNTNYEEVTAGSLNDMNSKMDYMFNIIRGRQLPIVDLGTSYTQELKEDISSGEFKKAVVGGRLTINGHKYLLAHPNYWKKTGDTKCTTNHMLVVPEVALGSGKMNSSNDTTGAYVGCGLKTGTNLDQTANAALSDVAAIIKADFGAANILTHRELFANATVDGKSSGWAWYDSDIDLMNEAMVYGCHAWAGSPKYETGIDKTQIKLFAERPDLITTLAYWWLRDVVSGTAFACVPNGGDADRTVASNSCGVRPAFAIC